MLKTHFHLTGKYAYIRLMQSGQCLFCGQIVQLVHVHGHYQCPVCFTNALPCCDGDNCNTNQLLAAAPNEKSHPGLRDGLENLMLQKYLS